MHRNSVQRLLPDEAVLERAAAAADVDVEGVALRRQLRRRTARAHVLQQVVRREADPRGRSGHADRARRDGRPLRHVRDELRYRKYQIAARVSATRCSGTDPTVLCWATLPLREPVIVSLLAVWSAKRPSESTHRATSRGVARKVHKLRSATHLGSGIRCVETRHGPNGALPSKPLEKVHCEPDSPMPCHLRAETSLDDA